MSQIDYEAEYNNRARVPEHPAIIAGWARDAQAYRDLNPPLRIAYGPSSCTKAAGAASLPGRVRRRSL